MIERRASGSSNALTFKNMLSVAHTLVDLDFSADGELGLPPNRTGLTVLRPRRRLSCSVSILASWYELSDRIGGRKHRQCWVCKVAGGMFKAVCAVCSRAVSRDAN